MKRNKYSLKFEKSYFEFFLLHFFIFNLLVLVFHMSPSQIWEDNVCSLLIGWDFGERKKVYYCGRIWKKCKAINIDVERRRKPVSISDFFIFNFILQFHLPLSLQVSQYYPQILKHLWTYWLGTKKKKKEKTRVTPTFNTENIFQI